MKKFIKVFTVVSATVLSLCVVKLLIDYIYNNFRIKYVSSEDDI